MNLETLQTSIDNVAAAVSLGMDVNAVSGSILHESYAEDQDEAGIIYVRGYHSSRESAINELLAFAFDVWDNDEQDLAPWWDYEAPEEGYEAFVAQARKEWVSGKTDEEILDEYFGEGFWSVSILKVEKPHSKPFNRN